MSRRTDVETIDAYESNFGFAFYGSFDANEDEEDPLVHICMVVGQRYQLTRRVLARCERDHVRAVVHAVPTCVACIARVYERTLPW